MNHTALPAAGGCNLFFVEQPITSVDCNIYEAERIVLTCTIESSEDILDSRLFVDPGRIRWYTYYSNGTESELTVGTNETRREGGNGDPIVVSSTLAISATSQQNAADLVQGSYYCRVHVSGCSHWGLLSNFSQKFTVLNHNVYLQHGTSCSERNFITAERVCAVYNIIGNPTTTETIGSPANFDYSIIYCQNILITSTKTMSMLYEPIQSTPGMPQVPPDQNDPTLKTRTYILAVMLPLFAIIIIIAMNTILVIYCLHKSKARKMAKNVDCGREFGIILDCMYVTMYRSFN